MLFFTFLEKSSGKFRVPILTAPVASLNLPFFNKWIATVESYYNKVTSYDVWQTPRMEGAAISSFDVIVQSPISTIFFDAAVLYDREQLNVEILEQRKLYDCPDVCYFVKHADVVDAIPNITPNDLENVQGYQVREMHQFAVAAMEKKFCFNMSVLEQKLNLSSLSVINEQWALFVPDIVAAAVQCRADKLNLTVEELAKFMDANSTAWYGFNMNQIESNFFPAFDDLFNRKFPFQDLNFVYKSELS